ncbi:hypothetical protein NX059_007597 [Plenodomus lindquistii]|nr:hypothetical protein NX059_007597 [Plenodomus lindquistii]
MGELRKTGQGARRKEHPQGTAASHQPYSFKVLPESDDPIEADDLYFTSGCKKRMFFRLDPIPDALQYTVLCFDRHHQLEGSEAEKQEYMDAVSKFHMLCAKQPTSGTGREAFKMARHFVLRMGPPNGPHSNADRAASKLDSLLKTHMTKRLKTSHFSIETEIPANRLVGTPYFSKYIETLRNCLKSDMGGRVTVELEPHKTQQLMQLNRRDWYNKKDEAKIEAEWQSKAIELKTGPSRLRIIDEALQSKQDGQQVSSTSEQTALAKETYIRWRMGSSPTSAAL